MIRRYETALFYFLLIAGGIWHLLGWFQLLMQHLAGPLLMGLSALLLVRFLEVQSRPAKAVQWAAIVILGGILFEWIGVRSGVIFGRYAYSETLQPQLAGVPVAIGFAWLSIQLGAAAVAQKLARIKHPLLFIVVIALLMVGFDVFMEPAAIYLNYWHWQTGFPPLQNYIGWFFIALLFSWLGMRWNLFTPRMPNLIFHSFWAQWIYFLLIALKGVL